ncbi:helix-turn-helix domain-containing protein [Streptomyces sp. NPDC048295]|uniref:helix-turn-helix domain-containing protein n=1 Tax=Streptomyces sp. NPDC048295 TaxID=3154617 RepID=UPI00343F8E4A
MHPASALRLHEGDLARLETLARMSTAPAGLVRRARIVLLAAEGASNTDVAARLRVSRPTVIKWRGRYEDAGIEALGDLPRPGRPSTVDEAAVLVTTLAHGGKPPARLDAPYWSSRLLAAELGIAHSTVSRVWRKWDVRPRRPESFRPPAEPPLSPGSHRSVVGVCLAPPWQAVVLRADERSGPWAEDRLRPLAVDRSRPAAGRAPALDVLRGFLDTVAQAHPYARLQILMDGASPAYARGLGAWQTRHPRVTLHRAAATCSWSELIEVLIAVSSGSALRSATFEADPSLSGSLRALVEARLGPRRDPLAPVPPGGGPAGGDRRSTSSIHRHPGTPHGPDVGPRPL